MTNDARYSIVFLFLFFFFCFVVAQLSAAPFHFGVPDLELEEARLYVGGVPPTVRISTALMVSVPGSFLGSSSKNPTHPNPS